ncbi:MAG: ADP-ribosylglycohydrolase family protein [Kiritimatiellae bacterium]|nr:ADP-ribosylglycohydrolase family protein [Kiritimatiellia bacterium]
MKQGTRIYAIVAFGIFAFSFAGAKERVLTLDDYRDKMKGAWIGQMVGVSWGQPTEFKWNNEIIPEDKVPVWASDFPLRMAYGNDDLYVEMTFLKTLEDYGLDVPIRQAGIDFANSEYNLWCANKAGRSNLRRGIAPPDCSHPKNNKCPNDIDYQIEADYAGIISPGCPQEAIRLGNVFGRLMNYGDGVWAGQFIGALYAEAFFTTNINTLLDAGLAAIPTESDYAQMVRNVRQWHRENPHDWKTCWQKIRAAYSKKFNPQLRDSNGGIDVRLNGACIVLGLLYGEGDLDRSMVLSMRCGWDSDCNPSNVGGILMAAYGLKELPGKYTEKLDYVRKFSYTAYNLPTLFAVCEKLARQVVARHGGRIEKGSDGKERFVIPVQVPHPDPFIPSWKAPAPERIRFTKEEMEKQKFALLLPDPESVNDPNPTVRVQKTLDALFPGWKTSPNAPDMDPGLVDSFAMTGGTVYGLLRTHPPKRNEAVTLARALTIPVEKPSLHFAVANSPGGDFRLVVRINGCAILSTIIDDPSGKCHLCTFDISLEPWAGKEAKIELVNEPTGWYNEAALWKDIRLTAQGQEHL